MTRIKSQKPPGNKVLLRRKVCRENIKNRENGEIKGDDGNKSRCQRGGFLLEKPGARRLHHILPKGNTHARDEQRDEKETEQVLEKKRALFFGSALT